MLVQLNTILAEAVLSVNVFGYFYLVHLSFNVCFGLGVGNDGCTFLSTLIHI